MEAPRSMNTQVVSTDPHALSAPGLRPAAHAFDLSVELEFALNADEAQRRAEIGLCSVDDIDLLRILARMPVGAEISPASLTRTAVRALRRAPAGSVHVRRGFLMRLLEVPGVVTSARATGSSWSQCLREVSNYASYCRREVLLTRDADGWDLAALESDWYGVGLASTSAPTEWIIAPREFVHARTTAASWRLAERAFGLMNEQGPGRL